MSKAGVDWPDIKRRCLAGKESMRSIAREYGIKHQSIMDRRKREGWDDPSAGWKPKSGRSEPDQNALPVSLPSIPRNQGGLRTLENKDFILSVVRRGFSLAKAAALSGFSEAAAKAWMAEDNDFRLDVMRAGFQYADRHLGNVGNAGDRGDWKASQWILETHPFTKDEMTPERSKQGTTFNININVPRPDMGDIVDITPE